MSDVKPWEPVSGFWLYDGTMSLHCSWPWNMAGPSCQFATMEKYGKLRVDLANGQRIIVRALSEERKAARAAMKEAVS